MSAVSEAGSVKLIGGTLCLDFTNTVGGRASSQTGKHSRNYFDTVVRDKLNSYTDLVEWSKHVGLLSDKETRNLIRLAKGKPSEAEAVFKRGNALREAIYRIFKSVVEKWQPEKADIETLNKELAVARDHERLAYDVDGFIWAWDDNGKSLDRLLWPAARSAAELLTSDDLSRLRQCSGEDCGWLFLDTSRNRSRQWCDMQNCGNLAKVRRFRSRQREK